VNGGHWPRARARANAISTEAFSVQVLKIERRRASQRWAVVSSWGLEHRKRGKVAGSRLVARLPTVAVATAHARRALQLRAPGKNARFVEAGPWRGADVGGVTVAQRKHGFLAFKGREVLRQPKHIVTRPSNQNAYA